MESLDLGSFQVLGEAGGGTGELRSRGCHERVSAGVWNMFAPFEEEGEDGLIHSGLSCDRIPGYWSTCWMARRTQRTRETRYWELGLDQRMLTKYASTQTRQKKMRSKTVGIVHSLLYVTVATGVACATTTTTYCCSLSLGSTTTAGIQLVLARDFGCTARRRRRSTTLGLRSCDYCFQVSFARTSRCSLSLWRGRI